MDVDSLDHYRQAFADPACWAAAIQYYRYGLPFHLVERAEGQPAGGPGERYRALSEREVAAMWLHEGGFDAHPDRWKEHDVAPEDRTTRFPRPALWLPAVPRGRGVGGSAQPYVTQFADYFPDLVTEGIAAGHFVGEEAAEEVNTALIGFLARARAGGGRR